MQTLIKRFLLISLLLPFQAIFADVSTQQACVAVQEKSHPVYLSNDFRQALCEVRKRCHQWSQRFVEFCDSLVEKNRVAATYAEAEAIAEECLDLCKSCPELKDIAAVVKQYEAHLRAGEANLILIDEDGVPNRGCSRKFKKGRAYCSLLTRDLRVCGPTVLDSLRVLGDSIFDGSITFSGDVTIGGTTITTNGITNYGFFSSQSLQTGIANGDPVEFETSNANNVGILHPNDTDFTVTSSGLYLVQFSAAIGTISLGNGLFGIRVNDVSVPTTIYGSNFVALGTPVNGFAFVRLSTTDVVTINNEATGTIDLTIAINGAATNNSAAVSFLRIAP